MNNEIPRYIAIEGVIGVGKTSLAHLLANKLDAELMLEDASNNPFLSDFYKDRKRFAFPVQLFFLLSRFQQLQSLVERDLFIERIVADYIFDKDALFASVTLSDREMALYEKMAVVLKRDVAKPDLVVYLQASTPVIMKRIKKRNLSFEKPLDRGYIDELNEAYNSFFFHYTEVPLLVVKTDNVNFIDNPNHLEDLIEQIKKPQPQTMYYAPSGDTDQRVL
ncbi:MAG: deoxynucleoside kinase [candidate division Zixibacteria bacterium]|nr:deoxynucleoside kinase [candidate division Zixibacteria bacterium]